MRNLVFTESAVKLLKKLDKEVQKRIKEKLVRYLEQENPLSYAKKLTNPKIWMYRRRIGDYRVIFDIGKYWKLIILLIIGHRKDIYDEV